MKKTIILLLLLILAVKSIAQTKAITETGEQVILYNDGTWKSLNDTNTVQNEIKTNNNDFSKSIDATFLVKSKTLNIGVWINPKVWSFEKSDDQTAEYKFEKKGESLYAMIITEKFKMPIETLIKYALVNAKSAAPDFQITRQEYRKVNGHKILMMQLTGTIEGIKLCYFGYYWADENGTFQFLTYTTQELLNQYSEDIEKFLNGIVFL